MTTDQLETVYFLKVGAEHKLEKLKRVSVPDITEIRAIFRMLLNIEAEYDFTKIPLDRRSEIRANVSFLLETIDVEHLNDAVAF